MIHAIATAQEALSYNFEGQTTVVIDVLRATTTMTMALRNGAKNIIAVPTPDDATTLKTNLINYQHTKAASSTTADFYSKISTFNPTDIILGGERNADKIAGFDLDNSPRGYIPSIVKDKTIIMTTTNGTQAINACQAANNILIASLANVKATITHLQSLLQNSANDIYIICSGTEGHFTIEDGLCAGLITHYLDAPKTDFAIAMEQLYLSALDKGQSTMATNQQLKDVASRGEHFKRLRRKGYEGDIDICFDTSLDCQPIQCSGGIITIMPSSTTVS